METQPAVARYGPNGIFIFLLYDLKTINEIPMTAPTQDYKIIIKGSNFQPSHAPNTANNLKSPWPIPSLPVANLYIILTDQNVP